MKQVSPNARRRRRWKEEKREKNEKFKDRKWVKLQRWKSILVIVALLHREKDLTTILCARFFRTKEEGRKGHGEFTPTHERGREREREREGGRDRSSIVQISFFRSKYTISSPAYSNRSFVWMNQKWVRERIRLHPPILLKIDSFYFFLLFQTLSFFLLLLFFFFFVRASFVSLFLFLCFGINLYSTHLSIIRPKNRMKQCQQEYINQNFCWKNKKNWFLTHSREFIEWGGKK